MSQGNWRKNTEKPKEKRLLTNVNQDLAKPADLLAMYIQKSVEALVP